MRDLHICRIIVKIYATYVLHLCVELMVSNALTQVYSVGEEVWHGRCGYRAHGQ